MRTNHLIFGWITLLFIVVFTSCEKEATLEADVTTEDDISTAETMTEDIDNELYRYGSPTTDSEPSPCVTVTHDQPQGTFPNTITVDYGTGCVGPDGRTRAGQIVIYLSDQLSNPGATLSATFVGFSINAVSIEGGKTITNNGLNANGKPFFTKVTDIFMTFPDGTSLEWHTNRTRTQILGNDTPTIWDDKFLIEGSAYGTNRNGVDFTITITQGLIKARNCPWISAGILEFSTQYFTRTLNFGDGDCDNKAIASDDQGHYRLVILHAGMGL